MKMANRRRDRRIRALRRTTKLPERCFTSRYVSFEPASNSAEGSIQEILGRRVGAQPEFAQCCRVNALLAASGWVVAGAKRFIMCAQLCAPAGTSDAALAAKLT